MADMTKEEAIVILIREIDEDIFVRTEHREQVHEALSMGIKALKHMDVLDKIVAEIEENINYNKRMDYKGILAGLLLALDIINHYKAESEDK